jgi:hypothetical protein
MGGQSLAVGGFTRRLQDALKNILQRPRRDPEVGKAGTPTDVTVSISISST